MVEWIRFAVFAVCGFFIGLIDFKTYRIPNALLFTQAGILISIDVLTDIKAISYRLLAFIFSIGLFYFVFRLKGGLGFGDVKYAGVAGYYLGLRLVLAGLLCAVLLGLVHWCIGRLVFRWGRDKRFPLGPWLCCGAMAADLFYRFLP